MIFQYSDYGATTRRILLAVVSFQVLDVLCSLCVCNGVAVRSNQNLITENLLPGRDLLLQTNIINYVTR